MSTATQRAQCPKEKRTNAEKKGTRPFAAVVPLCMAFAFALAFASCTKPRPLTERELAVQMAAGEQDTSIALQERCEPIGMQRVSDHRDARIVGAMLDADVAQVLLEHIEAASGWGYASSRKTTGLDVRYWRCSDKT